SNFKMFLPPRCTISQVCRNSKKRDIIPSRTFLRILGPSREQSTRESTTKSPAPLNLEGCHVECRPSEIGGGSRRCGDHAVTGGIFPAQFLSDDRELLQASRGKEDRIHSWDHDRSRW